ncbi:MAG: alpha/beta hydrolase [Betaproteobacteria bacterium]|nr:alpha/beta hydrolase [Betaproteobacteria bacterium]
MRSESVQCLSSSGFHHMRYTDWGDPANPRIVICAHGLTRNGRDFDDLARALEGDFRVICPDIAGRGRSDWLDNKQDYGYPQYMADANALLARATAGGPKTIHWIGTSMGGILGMLLAALPRSPLARLVVNDVGIVIPKLALERIARYVGKSPVFTSLDELEAHVRLISAPFGPLTDQQWRHLTVHGARQEGDGKWRMGYDPGIAVVFEKAAAADVDLSRYWDAVTCPTLLLRGAQSDVLAQEVAIQMTQHGPKPRLVEFSGVGHAPMLMAENQIRVVREFLKEPQ